MARRVSQNSVRLVGDIALRSDLMALRNGPMRSILRKALLAGARVVRDEARKLVPVRYGYLRRSIVANVSRKSMVARVMVDPKAEYIGPDGKMNVPSAYAHLVEFGTRKSKGHPFMRPALDTARGDAMLAIASSARASFESAVTRRKRRGKTSTLTGRPH